jgi:heat shock protein HspQ
MIGCGYGWLKTMVGKWINRRSARDGKLIEGEIVGEAQVSATDETSGRKTPREAVAARAGAAPIIIPKAEFGLGDVVRHRLFPFRGVIFDVDPEFANSEEWWEAIPEELRPHKDQPFYHLLAENDDSAYVAYVSQQNLLPDDSGLPVHHPAIGQMFDEADGRYVLKRSHAN